MSCQHSHDWFDSEKFNKELRANSFLATLSLRLASRQTNNTNVRLVRIYSGGETTKTLTYIHDALTKLAADGNMELEIETKNTDQLKNTGCRVASRVGCSLRIRLSFLQSGSTRVGPRSDKLGDAEADVQTRLPNIRRRRLPGHRVRQIHVPAGTWVSCQPYLESTAQWHDDEYG